MKRFLVIALSALMLMSSADASASGKRQRVPQAPGRQQTSVRPQRPGMRGVSFANGFGLTFGYAYSTYRTEDWATGDAKTSDGLHGFTVSINKDFRIIPRVLYFQTGLTYIYQNDERNEMLALPGFDSGLKIIGDRTEHYAGIPLRLKCAFPVADRIGLDIHAGPTLLMGLSSNMKYRTRYADGESSAVTYNIYSGKMNVDGMNGSWDMSEWMNESGMLPDGRLKRYDVMMGAAVGVDFFDLLEVHVGYDWGLVNRFRKDIADELKMNRNQFTLSVSLRF